MRGKTVIAGIGSTAFGTLPGRSTTSLITEATRNALADANVDKDMVDALLVKPSTSAPQLMTGQIVAEALGLQPKLGMSWDQGGAAVIGMISYASLAIEAGLCEVAVICFADNPKTGNSDVYRGSAGTDGLFGYIGVPAAYAMIARRHMEQYGTTPRQLGAVPVAARRHGAENPSAQLRKPLSMEDYLNEPYIVDPFRRSDCALVSDGGAAIVLMSAKRAKQLAVPAPVPIMGFGLGQSSWDLRLREDLTTTCATVSAATAFLEAGLTPKDVDVAQLYDCFSIVPIMTLEDYGFCQKGEGGAFVEDGRIEIDGDLPMNTAGGLLSETGMPGMQLVLEGVRQVRGNAKLQVKKSNTCIVSSQGGIMQTHGTLIIGG
jgi:acetyl-CoA acetyltransferase